MALPAQYLEEDYYTEDDYFAFEQQSLGHWEYVNGKIRAMAGGSDNHNAIASGIVAALFRALLPKGCRVYGSDIKIHTGDGVNTFPDAAVVCGPREYYQGRTDIITNPLLLVEVLSPSAESDDQGVKFDHYATIPALQDYLLVAQDEPCVLLYSREVDGWRLRQAVGLDAVIFLPSVDVTLTLSDVYALMEWEEVR